MKKSIRAMAVGTLIAVAVALLSSGVTLIGTGIVEHGKLAGQCVVSKTLTFKFAKANGQQMELSRVQPCRGTLKIQLLQTKGTNNTSYSIYVKDANKFSYRKVKTLKLKNNNASAYYKLATTINNISKYDVKVTKDNNTKKASTVKVKYLVS